VVEFVSICMRNRFARRFIFRLAASMLILCSMAPSLRAQSGGSEYEIKAAFMFNFAKFIEWPAEKLPQATSPIIFGVVGEDPFISPDGVDELKKTLESKTIGGRPVKIRRFRADEPMDACHVLFVSNSERRRFGSIVNALRGKSVLTVADTSGFCQAGGMINFRVEADKVRFDINQQAAEKENLKISSKLLSIAYKLVRTGE
jgi:hypothetical protein